MAFRRQDIPKTTRKGKDGAPRRLYPRFIRDGAMAPKVALAIDYLDGMIGRKRSELSPDVVLDLFGDPKLARCMLSCLAESYRYRSLDFTEVVGAEAATALAGWNLFTPADLRGLVYHRANSAGGGFVSRADRPRFLAETSTPLGLSGEQLDTLLTLDSEQNQRLVRIGPKPVPDDIVARYNVILLTSILRNAASIEITAPGLEATTIETILTRYGVEGRRSGSDSIRLIGRRNAFGSWAGFGHRLARAATQLVALSPHGPMLHAVVQLGDQTSELILDAKALAPLRPANRAVADTAGIVRASLLDEDVTTLRRRRGDELAGWSVRRLPDPVVVDGALLIPELAFVRGQLVVPIISVPSGAGRTPALKAAAGVGAQRPVVALGVSGASHGVYGLATPEAALLVRLLDAVIIDYDLEATPQTVLRSELEQSGWVPAARITELFAGSELPIDIQGWLDDGLATLVPGFGIGSIGFLEELSDRIFSGPTDIAAARSQIAEQIGNAAAADALTLHLLGQQLVTNSPNSLVEDGPAVAA